MVYEAIGVRVHVISLGLLLWQRVRYDKKILSALSYAIVHSNVTNICIDYIGFIMGRACGRENSCGSVGLV